MKIAMLAAIFALLTLAVPVRAINCKRECAQRPHSVNCAKCGALASSAEKKAKEEEAKTLRTGHLGELTDGDPSSTQGLWIDEKLFVGMEDKELQKWRGEYSRRQSVWDKKCNSVPDDDPKIDEVKAACERGREGIDGKLKSIDEEIGRRKTADEAAQTRARQCAQSESLPDRDYCAYACGKCSAVGQPLDRLRERAKAANKKDRKRQQKPGKKSGDPKVVGYTSVEGCLQAKCATVCPSNEVPNNCDACKRINTSMCRGMHREYDGQLHH